MFAQRTHLLDLKHLDVKHQLRVRWDARECFATVRLIGGDGNTALAADLHAGHCVEDDVSAMNAAV